MILSGTLNNAFGTMVMVDYPYATDFIEPLPAWPINYACD
jgi:dipeptidyl-peptidase-2